MICGSLDCIPCQDEFRKRTPPLEDEGAWVWPGKAPTKEQLDRHLRHYGPDGIAEVAAAYGITYSGPMKQRRRGAKTQEEVERLTLDGYSIQAVADALGISVKTVRNARSRMASE